MYKQERLQTFRCDLCSYEVVNADSKPSNFLPLTAYNLHVKPAGAGLSHTSPMTAGTIHLCYWCTRTIKQVAQPKIE